MSQSVCDFCKGRPVQDASAWVTGGKPLAMVACPRCGETNLPREDGAMTCLSCKRTDSTYEPAAEWWYWQREGYWLCDDCYNP